MQSEPYSFARWLILWAIIISAVIGVYFLDPVPQDPGYHHFADQHSFFGITHAINVSSNLLFLLIGTVCLYLIYLHKDALKQPYKTEAIVFYLGFILITFGSAYYHLAPDNASLAWDRYSMIFSFAGFFSFVISQHLNEKAGSLLLIPLIITGLASISYWIQGETVGTGDLRPYIIIQYLPALLIPIILVLFPATNYKEKYTWYSLLLYAAAKVAEVYDAEIMNALGLISGHSLKHIMSALIGITFYKAIKTSEVSNTVSPSDYR